MISYNVLLVKMNICFYENGITSPNITPPEIAAIEL